MNHCLHLKQEDVMFTYPDNNKMIILAVAALLVILAVMLFNAIPPNMTVTTPCATF
jgi:hypothetical protein